MDGHASHGKTFLVATLCDRVHVDSGIACVTSTTALSVIYYEHGQTAHSAFGIPIQESDMGLESKLSPHSACTALLHQADLVIWEELLMAKKAIMEYID